MKPLIIFDGNCQSHHLAAILDATGLAEAFVNGRDYGMIPSFDGRLCRYLDESDCLARVKEAKKAGRTAIQASQATPMASLLEASYSSEVDILARFPYLQFSPMLLANQNLDRVPNYTRSYEVDIQLIRLCQSEANCSIDFASYIETQHHLGPLFHMHVHPGPELTQLLLRCLCAQVPGLDGNKVDAVARRVAASEGINMFTQHPLTPELRTTLGFSWPSQYENYGAMIEASRRADYDTLARRRDEFLDLFGNDSQFWAADFNRALAGGDQSEISEAFENLSALSTGYIGTWYVMYVYGGRDRQILARASEVFKGQRQLDQFLSRIASEEGRHDEAVALAERYRDVSMDLADGVVPLVLALQRGGHDEEAQRQGRDFVNRTPEHRQAEVIAILADLPQPILAETVSTSA